MAEDASREVLVRGAHALAHVDRLESSLEILLGVIAEYLGIESAVIVVVDGAHERLSIVASHGLGEPAAAGLAQAISNPGHPIARTVAEPVPAFDVRPTAPGGPALRSHLPLTVTRNGATTVVGVLALAHEQPIAPVSRSLLQAAADLAAVAIEHQR